MKRRNDPTSTKVSTILGSYDKAKELVTSSHMIGAILQPATPRPCKDTAPPLLAAVSRSSQKHTASRAARNGLRSEPSRQGVFEQFQQSTAGHDDQLDTAVSVVSVSSSDAQCQKPLDSSRRSAHVANGRHKSSTSKHSRPKLSIPSPKVSTHTGHYR